MKLLNGADLAGYIKERQAKEVRALRQAHHVMPQLSIVQTIDDSVIDTYVRLKQAYGADILIDVAIHKIDQTEARTVIERLNSDESVHGIIIQLPLADTSATDELVNLVAPGKDVDGLAEKTAFDPATPMAVNWLLAGYNIELKQKKIVIVGHGRLVGAPLARIWRSSGLDVTVVERSTEELASVVQAADVLVSATGSPGLITSEMVRPDTVVIDAGTASESGKIIGDLAIEVRQRTDLTITPERGGVGPLTVAALFDNVIRSARATISG